MFWVILLGALSVVVLWKLIFREENPVNSLPGPKGYPVIGSITTFVGLSPKQMFLLMRQFVATYGDRYVVKMIGRRIVHICSPKDVEIVLAHSRNISKSYAYSFMQPWLGTGLLLSTDAKWHKRRKILTPTFHFNVLRNFSRVMEEKCRRFVDYLKETNGEEVNLMPIVSDFTLNTICETAMGTQLDSDKSADTVQYKSAILNIGSLLMRRLTRVWLHSDLVFFRLPVGKKFQNALDTVQSFADKVIMEKKQKRLQNLKEKTESEDEDIGKKKRLAMLDLLLESESKGEIDLEGIREEVNTFMFEGHDTTATALTFGLMLLADHEEVQERIFEEHMSVGEDNYAEMKYLEAVIKEILRLYPSVPFIARQITEDFMMDDILVRKGTEIAVHIYDLHRRADLYPDPTAFQPERFLSGEIRHPFAYVPFSAGPRNCIGQRFAMQEIKCALSQICRNFKLQPRTRGERPALVADMVLRPADDIYVKFLKR